MPKYAVICPKCKIEKIIYVRSDRNSFTCCNNSWKVVLNLSPLDQKLQKYKSKTQHFTTSLGEKIPFGTQKKTKKPPISDEIDVIFDENLTDDKQNFVVAKNERGQK